MKSNGIITLSSVPNDRKQAELLNAQIESGEVTIHPEQSEEIIGKLKKVISGEYKKVEDKEIKYFEEQQQYANDNIEKLNSIMDTLNLSLISLQEAEESMQFICRRYKYQYELTKSKLAILEVLKSLEGEINNFKRDLPPYF
jgi:hypothetical protein